MINLVDQMFDLPIDLPVLLSIINWLRLFIGNHCH